jgi:parallel beta-helix repeat protein
VTQTVREPRDFRRTPGSIANPRLPEFRWKRGPMKRRIGILWGITAILMGIGAGGCIYTPQAKITPPITIPFKGDFRFDKSLQERPPQTVAVLPFLNRTDQKEAFDIVRKSFHGHFSTLNYTAVPLYKIDHALRQAGLDTPDKVAKTPTPKLREILQADALIQGEITHYDRIYVGVYSQVAVGAEVRMVEAKTDKELWWAKNVSRKHGGGIATTPVGLILTAVSTAFNMREIELLRSSDDLFRQMVRSIPQPTLAQALRPPAIAILAHDGMRRTDRYALKAGDVLKVALEGDPRKKASFRIGNFKTDIPMKEEEPGMYSGTYRVLPGDFVEEALITGVLADDQRNSTEWVDALGPVSLDTIPPAVPGGIRAIGRDKTVELSWAKSADKDIGQYRVYRSNTPLTGFQEVGKTELALFKDPNLANETPYFYRIAAVDLAGNESKPSDSLRATPVTPGPTRVKGLIQEDVTWFAGASPYILEDSVTVEARATLTIEPGTAIHSRGGGLVVSGKLLAQGDPKNMTVFEPASPGGEWKGILFQGTRNEESALQYVKISGAQAGITCLSSSPLILGNDLSKNRVGLRIQESFSKPRVQGNVISANTAGVEILGGAAPVLEENEIQGNQKDGVLIRESNPSLQKNRILNNGEAGVRLFSSSPRLTQNNIHDNGKFEVYNDRQRDLPVEALENWWGAKEGPRLAGRIYGRVDYRRVLDAPFPQGKSIELPILKGPLAGPLTRDSFLILAYSPYVVDRELTVDDGATLFIQPGVTLRFNPGASVVVKNGGIDARGTPEGWITFTTGSASPSPGAYPAAVRFEKSGAVASFFRHCIIEFAETGLEIAYGAPEIDRCLIAKNGQAGIKVTHEGAPKISYSTFAQNTGTGALVVLGTARPRITRNNFQDNHFAIQSHSTIYVDARENWWGASPPPESHILGEINLKPWLERPEPEAFTGRKP